MFLCSYVQKKTRGANSVYFREFSVRIKYVLLLYKKYGAASVVVACRLAWVAQFVSLLTMKIFR